MLTTVGGAVVIWLMIVGGVGCSCCLKMALPHAKPARAKATVEPTVKNHWYRRSLRSLALKAISSRLNPSSLTRSALRISSRNASSDFRRSSLAFANSSERTISICSFGVKYGSHSTYFAHTRGSSITMLKAVKLVFVAGFVRTKPRPRWKPEFFRQRILRKYMINNNLSDVLRTPIFKLNGV